MATATVNSPTRESVKDKDIEFKLRLYGIFEAFSMGKVPSNKQIDVAMNSALQSRGLASPSKRLSPEGQQLIGELRDMINQAKILVLTKNDGNLIQDFIWQSQHVGGGNAQKPGAPIDKQGAQAHGNEAAEGLRTLGQLLISNGQFRKLLSDATILLRDIAGDAAQNAANRINPNEDELSQIDKPANDNEWHDVPDLSRDNIRNQAKQQFNKQKPFNRDEMRQATGDATQAAHPSGSRDPADAAETAARDQQQGTDSGMDARQGVKAGINRLRDQASQNVPEETKERQRKAMDKTKEYMEKKLPQERREQAIWRLKKMVVEIQSHQDYQRAIDTLLRLAETYTGYTRNLADQSAGAVKGAHTDSSLKTIEADLRTLLERFANSTSADDMLEAINQLYKDAEQDPELKNWFKNMNGYVRKCLKEQGFIMQDQATEEWNRLYDQGQFLLKDRYRNHTNRIIDEIKFFVTQFDEDQQNKAFAQSVERLFQHLGNDENGQPKFKKHLLDDVANVLLPAFFENIKYIPIPRIEYSDPTVDLILENLIIEGDNLTPNSVGFENHIARTWGRKDQKTRGFKSSGKADGSLSVSGIQMDLKDFSFYFRKKGGSTKVYKGTADIFLGGSGLSFTVGLESAGTADKNHIIKVRKVGGKDDIKLDIRNFKLVVKTLPGHTFTKLAVKLGMSAFGLFKPAIEKAIAAQIKNQIDTADSYLYDIHKEVKRAEAEAKRNPDPQNVQNIYQRYFNAAQKKFMSGKQKGQEKAKNKTTNVAFTMEDSIFPDIPLEKGVSSKATKYKDMARRGDKWQSEVFDIGSAKPTSNLPQVPSITRKPHNVTQGGVRGKPNAGQTSGMTNETSDYAGGYDGSNYSNNDANTYGQNAGSYGQSGYAQDGYDQSAGGYGISDGGAKFSNQVNQAFGSDSHDEYRLQSTPATNGPIGSGQHTLLGVHNPVYEGRA